MRIPVPAQRVASRVLKGQAILLHPEVDELQRLNEVGSFVWARLLERRHDEAALAAALCAEFEVSPEEAAEDLRVFLERLVTRGLVAFEDRAEPPPAGG